MSSNRRDFLKTTAGVAAATATGTLLAPSVASAQGAWSNQPEKGATSRPTPPLVTTCPTNASLSL